MTQRHIIEDRNDRLHPMKIKILSIWHTSEFVCKSEWSGVFTFEHCIGTPGIHVIMDLCTYSPLQPSDDELGKLNVLSLPELCYSWLMLGGSSRDQRMRFD